VWNLAVAASDSEAHAAHWLRPRRPDYGRQKSDVHDGNGNKDDHGIFS
jgi:hypothetical protein